MWMEIGYDRVSTQDQHPTLQLDALHGAGCAKVFVEQASGAQRDRPQLQAALDYARPGNTLVVWKLDRLARSLKQLIETIELLATRDIGFRSLTEAIDITTAGGRLVFHIFASLAEFERAIIRERTRAGLDAAKAMLADPTLTVGDAARQLRVADARRRTRMCEDTTYPHITLNARGVPCLDGTRHRLIDLVADHVAHGYSAAQIVEQYPDLTPAQVHAAFTYYYDHQDAMDAALVASYA
jgi:DNA invertase Pin-like site-specific DNA recombinase